MLGYLCNFCLTVIVMYIFFNLKVSFLLKRVRQQISGIASAQNNASPHSQKPSDNKQIYKNDNTDN